MSKPDMIVNRCRVCDCVAKEGICPDCEQIDSVEQVEDYPVKPLVSEEDMEFFRMYDRAEFNKFYRRLYKALGGDETHEGRELGDDIAREFFKDFIDSGLTFYEWFEQQYWS